MTSSGPWPVASVVGAGLRGAIACFTRVAEEDDSGRVIAYRGRPIDGVLDTYTWEEIAFLLVTGTSPHDEPTAFRAFRDASVAAFEEPSHSIAEELLRSSRSLGGSVTPLDLLRAEILADASPVWQGLAAESTAPRALGRIVRAGVDATCAWRGKPDVPRLIASEKEALSAPLCAVLLPEGSTASTRSAFDRVLGGSADEGFTSRVFASVVVASCEADLASALCAGLFEEKQRDHEPNVALGALGIEPALVPLAGAIARSAGLLARLCELRAEGRLFRPFERYVGVGERVLPPREARS